MTERMTAAEYRKLVDRQSKGHQSSGKAGDRAADALAMQLHFAGIDGWIREHVWHADRKWRLDFAWPHLQLAVEVDGQVHKIRDKFTRDCEKMNELALAGWTVLHVEPAQVHNGSALILIERGLKGDSSQTDVG